MVFSHSLLIMKISIPDINKFFINEDWKSSDIFGPGIATPMSYISSQLSQFCWHQEDAGLLSVNIVTLPSDYDSMKSPIPAKIWFIVPMRHAQKWWGYLKSEVNKSPWSKDEWLLPTVEIAKECEMKMLVQHEGEMIMTAPHCGINANPSYAESINTMFQHAVNYWFGKKRYDLTKWRKLMVARNCKIELRSQRLLCKLPLIIINWNLF